MHQIEWQRHQNQLGCWNFCRKPKKNVEPKIRLHNTKRIDPDAMGSEIWIDNRIDMPKWKAFFHKEMKRFPRVPMGRVKEIRIKNQEASKIFSKVRSLDNA